MFRTIEKPEAWKLASPVSWTGEVTLGLEPEPAGFWREVTQVVQV
jgi:hypothetical protein